MNVKLKKGIAILVPVMGFATIGAVGAQMLEPESSEGVQAAEAQVVTQAPSELPADTNVVTLDPTTTAALDPNESVVVVDKSTEAPIIVAQNTVTTDGAVANPSYRVIAPGLALPPAASPRSGEGSLEEIATRFNPVDVRAQLFPEYLVDHSPGV